jgi:CPA2 family monovalent cation:H+ antiporter-2
MFRESWHRLRLKYHRRVMHELDFLKDLVVVFAAGLAVVALLGRLRVPSIAGYIVAGVLVGPGVLGLIGDPHQVEVLAEVGVVLLLFGIGLELSLDRIRRILRAVLVGGALQVGASILGVIAVARIFELPYAEATFLGFVVAISSTAIVLRGLSARGELDAPHGRFAVGILIFQDLCVVPMMLALPFLAGSEGTGGQALSTLGAAVVLLGGALLVARVGAPLLLRVASRTRQRDVFVLAVAVICLGVAWLASYAGVSVALGAFLAGLVVSGSEFRHQALSDLIPLREVLASVFFVSVGMLLDTTDVLGRAAPILILLIAILVGKFAVVFLTGAVMRLPLRVCVLTAVGLCQVGEFSFVLLRSGSDAGLVSEPFLETLLVAVILSMLVTPFLLRVGPRLAAGVGRITPLTKLLSVKSLEEDHPEEELAGHVIIAGYGLAGLELARTLEHCRVPYLVVDINVDNVRQAHGDGVTAYFGDVTSPEVLEYLGIERARELVVAVNDPDAALRAVRLARGLSRDLRILVRTAYLEDATRLLKAGASDVVAADVESTVEIVHRILSGHGADAATVEDQLARIRSRRVEADP